MKRVFASVSLVVVGCVSSPASEDHALPLVGAGTGGDTYGGGGPPDCPYGELCCDDEVCCAHRGGYGDLLCLPVDMGIELDGDDAAPAGDPSSISFLGLCIKTPFGGTAVYEGSWRQDNGRARFAIIPEDSTPNTVAATTSPADNTWYDSDGVFWWGATAPQGGPCGNTEWFKIPNHCRAYVRELANGNFSMNRQCCNAAALALGYQPSHWQTTPVHGTFNPFVVAPNLPPPPACTRVADPAP
jgi:hypothetical protein